MEAKVHANLVIPEYMVVVHYIKLTQLITYDEHAVNVFKNSLVVE